MHKKITIKDVAQHAGVAISTVSRVFNGLDKVSDETREKVQRAVTELQYVPSSIAASMITGATKVILIMIPDFTNSYYTSIVQGAEEVLRKNGYFAMILSMGSGMSTDYSQIQSKFDKMIDGIITIPTSSDLEFYRAWGKPFVVTDRYNLGSGMNAVVSDNRLGAFRLTEELIHANHRKIAFISGEMELSTVTERLKGFREALAAHHIPEIPEYVLCDSFSVETGYRFTKQLLSLPEPPTAIFASNNLICYGCIQALQELHLTIGKDISLVGFDDHVLARHVPPGITVIEQPALTVGKQAAQRLLDMIATTDDINYKEIVLGVKLIRRGSVKKLHPDE